MPRKSRRNPTSDKIEQIIYSVAIYLRLSILDSGKKSKQVIHNQEVLVRQFLEDRQEFNIYRTYIDNGQTGTNFKRPGFQQLLFDIKEKKINCIVVKDLSRFGRNYLEVGEYLERIFPTSGIRFIAIDDGYDSLTTNFSCTFNMHLQNLTNEKFA